MIIVECMTLSFNPRARDGREGIVLNISIGQVSFNPRARDGREFQAQPVTSL